MAKFSTESVEEVNGSQFHILKNITLHSAVKKKKTFQEGGQIKMFLDEQTKIESPPKAAKHKKFQDYCIDRRKLKPERSLV